MLRLRHLSLRTLPRGLTSFSTSATTVKTDPEPILRYVSKPSTDTTSALRLNDLRDNPGAKKKKVRLGRGRGTGCGKTSGRGQKGQKARNSVPLWFEGGQTPITKRFPKKRWHDPWERELQEVPLGRIQRYIDIGRLDKEKVIGMKELVKSGCCRKFKHGVVLVTGGGAFVEKVKIQVTEVESEAAKAVVANGGAVELAWYNRLGFLRLLRPERWEKKGGLLPRWARPPPKMEHRYPVQNEDGVWVRPLDNVEDINEAEEAWKRIVHLRKSVSLA